MNKWKIQYKDKLLLVEHRDKDPFMTVAQTNGVIEDVVQKIEEIINDMKQK
jgi:hypothetical protein